MLVVFRNRRRVNSVQTRQSGSDYGLSLSQFCKVAIFLRQVEVTCSEMHLGAVLSDLNSARRAEIGELVTLYDGVYPSPNPEIRHPKPETRKPTPDT
jgi:hypothetical protein